MTRVALYARISLDRRDGEGVARQIALCRGLAKRRGWRSVAEYVDNDVSAYRQMKRPEWDRLLDDLGSGRVDVLVGYHPDRFYRRLLELERLIDLVEATKVEVATVLDGDIDLSTATGRMKARIVAVVNRHEAERIGERVADSKQWRASQGKPAGGGKRAFGLTVDRSGLVDHEADALRVAAKAILAGASWSSQVDLLNEQEIRQTAGGQWEIGTLRKVLTSPHVAGLRAYKGEVVAEASWPAIITRDEWDALRMGAMARRRGRPPSDRHLLTGLLVCGLCGTRMFVNANKVLQYRCHPAQTTRGKGCGKIAIGRDLVEDYVASEVKGWFARPNAIRQIDTYLSHGDSDADSARARAELAEIERRQEVLIGKWAAGELTDAEHEAARRVLGDRKVKAEAKVIGYSRPVLSITAAEIADGWENLSVPERRAVIGGLVRAPMRVAPGRTPDNQVVPVDDRVKVVPAWA